MHEQNNLWNAWHAITRRIMACPRYSYHEHWSHSNQGVVTLDREVGYTQTAILRHWKDSPTSTTDTYRWWRNRNIIQFSVLVSLLSLLSSILLRFNRMVCGSPAPWLNICLRVITIWLCLSSSCCYDDYRRKIVSLPHSVFGGWQVLPNLLWYWSIIVSIKYTLKNILETLSLRHDSIKVVAKLEDPNPKFLS